MWFKWNNYKGILVLMGLPNFFIEKRDVFWWLSILMAYVLNKEGFKLVSFKRLNRRDAEILDSAPIPYPRAYPSFAGTLADSQFLQVPVFLFKERGRLPRRAGRQTRGAEPWHEEAVRNRVPTQAATRFKKDCEFLSQSTLLMSLVTLREKNSDSRFDASKRIVASHRRTWVDNDKEAEIATILLTRGRSTRETETPRG